MAQEPEEGGGEGAAGGGKGLAPGYTACVRAEFVFFCSETMDCSLDFRVLIAAVSQVPLGAGPGAEDGADWVLLAVGAASTLSHVQEGEQEESSLHMRWGCWPSQMSLAAVQPPQWATVPHVYLLHQFMQVPVIAEAPPRKATSSTPAPRMAPRGAFLPAGQRCGGQ